MAFKEPSKGSHRTMGIRAPKAIASPPLLGMGREWTFLSSGMSRYMQMDRKTAQDRNEGDGGENRNEEGGKENHSRRPGVICCYQRNP